MLAIKSILAGSDRISVLVFDEIDANIGGRLYHLRLNKCIILEKGAEIFIKFDAFWDFIKHVQIVWRVNWFDSFGV